MRIIVATALLIGATAGVAMAADLPLRSPPPAPYVPPPPVFTWSGGYFGINAGYAFDYNSRFHSFNGAAPFNDPSGNGVDNGNPTIAAPNRVRSVDVGSDGFTAGGQIGYNYQFGAGSGIVVGVEADAAYTDLGQTNDYIKGLGLGSLTRLHSDMDFLGTVRGRIGYAFDRFLVYGTGGFAYGDVTHSSRFYADNTTNTLLFAGSRNAIQTGYAYGGGVEFAVSTDSFLNSLNVFHSSAVTIKAEYLHYDLGSVGLTVPAVVGNGGTGAYTQRIRTDGDLARIGINYKF